MSNFFKLIYNELFKIFVRKSTWFMFIALLIVLLGMGFLEKGFGDDYTNENWRTELEQENKNLQKDLEEDDIEDSPFYDFAMSTIEENNYRLENDIMPLSTGGWSFMYLTASFLGLVSLFTIVIAAGIVANEFSQGTIKLLLIRPIHRSVILLSKYIAVLIFGFITAVSLLLLSLGVGGILFGFEEHIPAVVIENTEGLTHLSVLKETIYGYSFYSVNLIMITTLAFMISAVFRNNALSIGVALFLLFTGNTVVQFFSDKEWAKYILFANTDLRPYFGGKPLFEGMTLSFSVITLLVYYAIFVFLAWGIFTKRDVA
ncbi:MAG TPA: ABC transporter permease [Cerasibacillus sp.]|uniref:ABC transporter permease n=1 Tax=Cerasibacillus sp. TaxID=2498711 RepID=UPI002F3F030E